MTPPDAATPGWYGKLSSLGDFASRRLPPQWIRLCDQWLSREMRSAEQALGERWLGVYLTAPVLRFAWAPGVVDAQWWFGVLMPSCDNVGRYFPLVIAHGREAPPTDTRGLEHLDRWYAHLSAAALATLDDRGHTPEELDAGLAQAPAWPPAGDAVSPAATSDTKRTHYRWSGGEPLARRMPLLAGQALLQHWSGCTLWWRTAPSGETESMDVLPGLPEDLARLLDSDPN